MKDLEKLQQITNEICDHYAVDRVTITLDLFDDNYFDEVENRINLNPYQPDCGFMRHLREKHACPLADKYSLSVWSYLHELGHYFTLDVWESEEEGIIRAVCALTPLAEAQSNTAMQDKYFGLSREWEATEWAIGFAKANPDILSLLSCCVGG